MWFRKQNRKANSRSTNLARISPSMIKHDRASRKRSCQENSRDCESPSFQQQCGYYDGRMKRFGMSASASEPQMEVEGPPAVFEEGRSQNSMRDGTVDMRVNNLCSLHEERGISVRPHSETNTESKMMNAWAIRSHIQRIQRQAKKDMELATYQVRHGIQPGTSMEEDDGEALVEKFPGNPGRFQLHGYCG